MNKERLNPHFNINAKYEAMIRDSKEIVKHYLSKESNGEPNEGVCLAYDVKNYLPSLLEENNQLKEQKKELRSWLEEYFKGMTIDDIPIDDYYKKGMFRMNEYTLDKLNELENENDR